MRTDYLGFEAFVAIADLGSFSRAASHLNLSQTALSHRIRKLEADLGVELFLRTTREVSLTKQAQEILPDVRQSLMTLGAAFSNLSEQGRARSARLSFACLPTLSYNHIPPVLRQFSERFPEIVIRLEDRPVAKIYEMVQAADVEFGVSIVAASQWDLEIRPFHVESYKLYVRHDDPLARLPSVTRDMLRGRVFVQIVTQSRNRQMVDEALGEHAETYLWRYQVQSAAMALSLVAEGTAVTILPSLMADLGWQGLVALPFSDVEITRTLCFVTRRGAALSDPAQHLTRLIEERVADRALHVPVTASQAPRG